MINKIIYPPRRPIIDEYVANIHSYVHVDYPGMPSIYLELAQFLVSSA